MKLLYASAIFILIQTAGCGGPVENTEQENFNRAFGTLASELQDLEAEKLVGWIGNNLRPANLDQQLEEKQRKLDELLGDKDRQVNSWNAEVDSLNRDGSNIIIRASYGNMLYRLRIFDSTARIIAEEIKEGDLIVFSGTLGAEASLTKMGAALAPVFDFYPTEVLWQSKKLSQSISAIKELNDEQERLLQKQKIESAARQDEIKLGQFVKAECRNLVLKKLKYPASGSFSWFKSELNKKSIDIWTYSDVVSAKNQFGGDLPIRFVCEGKYIREKLNLSVKFLD